MASLYSAAPIRTHREPAVVDYVNIRWVDDWCKRCNICVEICPKETLVLTHDAIIEAEDCIRCGLCERYCPDLAIEMLPRPGEEPTGAAAHGVAARVAAKLAGARTAAAAPAAPGAVEPPAAPAPHRPRPRFVPEAARGPAIAGKDPARGVDPSEGTLGNERANAT